MSEVLDVIQGARAAAARGAWRDAYAGYGTAVESLAAADLESYGEAAWWSGKLEEAISLRERAYAAYTAAADVLGAARMAIILAWDHEGRGAFAVSGGWLSNAERLLADAPEAPEHGRLLLTHAITALFAEGDIERATGLFEDTYALASRIGDRDVQMLALGGQGRAAIKAGDTDRGLALLDEASASAMCGDLRPHAAGLVYCMTISACQDLGDFRRAAEWTEAANRMCDKLDVTGFPGQCRIHRAEALRLRGDWPAAEAQAVAACEELSDFDRSITASGFYEIGEIRRQRGDLAGAEEAYRTSNELGREPQPGLALLRLAEGKVDAAVAGISSTLREAEDPIFRFRRLPAQVEIAIAAGDIRTARAAAEEMERIVDAYKIGNRRTLAFDATIHIAYGRIEVAEKDWDGSIRSLRRARDEWKEVGAPYETAQARMLLGIALQRQNDAHGAEVELEGALAAFEKLGAAPDEARVKELLGRIATRRTFLFTDIVDSTKLLETLGSEKWQRLLARHDEILRDRITEAGGEIVKKTGDGFFASFENPKAAIDAAVGIQRALDAEIVAPDVRIGAHAGDAFRSGGDTSDYGGQGVHVAARVGALAGAREIVVSRETLEGVATSFRISEPRTETLKGVAEPLEIVSVDWR
ncbi:MAG: adenylate/guanylate cyclase domain-containing protein [Gaiellaceae bacterium]